MTEVLEVNDRPELSSVGDRLARLGHILLVTHDSRILDIADRIVYMEDGRLASKSDAV